MNKNIKSIIEGILIAVLLGLAIAFVRTVLTSSWEQNDRIGDKGGGVNIVLNDKKPKPITRNLDNDMYKPVALNDFDKNRSVVNINIEPLENFSGLSAKEILDMRTEAVKSSPLFINRTDYKPSDEVFRIEDGLPWIGAHQVSCYGADNNPDIGKGASRESLAILNPEIMFYSIVPSYKFADRGKACSKEDYLLPYKANYTPNDNTIHTYFRYQPIKEKTGYFGNIILADANAHDLGYNYVHAESSKNIRFKENKFGSEIIRTRGYYHRGFSCGLDGGCNNYSPFETGYEFYLTDLPAELNIKLWNKQPENVNEQPDLVYQMVFE